MKVKVSEATGNALRWAVALAQGYRPLFSGDYIMPRSDERRVCVMSNELGIKVASTFPVVFEPDVNWNLGGPIIEREGIELKRGLVTPFVWAAFAFRIFRAHRCGPTPLIAAMRCFVASKLGDEVDVPEELL